MVYIRSLGLKNLPIGNLGYKEGFGTTWVYEDKSISKLGYGIIFHFPFHPLGHKLYKFIDFFHTMVPFSYSLLATCCLK